MQLRTASTFHETHRHFLPQTDDVGDDVQLPLYIVEDQKPQSRQFLGMLIEEDQKPQSRQFLSMLSAVNLSLYPGCKTHIQISIIGQMMSLKTNLHILKKL